MIRFASPWWLLLAALVIARILLRVSQQRLKWSALVPALSVVDMISTCAATGIM